MFAGIFQIVHTPFDQDGSIDWESLETQVDFSLAAGVHGLVVPAMASEFFSLSDRERTALVRRVCELVEGRVPTIGCVQGVSVQHAMALADEAVAAGVQGLMAMPPYLRKPTAREVVHYFTTLGGIGLPLIIQNAPPPIGTPLDARQLAELMATVEAIQYVKEEAAPILHRISSIVAAAEQGCSGVFGGANGLYLLDELDRGACGNMPAGGFVDVQVRIYELYRSGDRAAAQALQDRLLPLLGYASMYGVTAHKHLLHRRGVLRSPTHRDPQGIELDTADARAIERAWDLVRDASLARYPLAA